jgi:Heterokaryon incompatibility protein (HET)
MYCFPYPQASDVTPLRAPYIATYTYSLAGQYTFDSFYETTFSDKPTGLPQGSVSALRSILSLLRPPSASIIQSWLFFGLASEALGRDVTHDEFLERCATGTSETSIDLRIPLWFLSEFKARWKRLRNTLSTDAYKRKERELEQCCFLVLMTLGFRDLQKDGDTELSLVVLSVHMLLYLICDIFSSAKLPRTVLRSKSTQVLTQRMLANGWCRKRLNFVGSIRMFYPAFYFMSSFRPPQGQNEDHQSCTPAKCHVTTGLVEPFHRTDDCKCQDVHVPLEPVLRIVAVGGIPLIRIGHSPSGEVSLEVVPYVRTIRFAAISHVWADRQLGSTRNALPRCQVEYLDSMLAALPRNDRDWRLRDWLPKWSPTSGPIEPPSRTYEYFWLDTFCIPQDIQHCDLKHKAIGSMNLIYAAASQTLVFDFGLQKFDAGQHPSSLLCGGRPTFYAPTDKSLLDVLAHLCASNWMGRAW